MILFFKKIIFTFIVVFFAIKLAAQSVSSLTVNPTSPTTSTNVSVNIAYDVWSGCWSMAGTSTFWSGNTVNIYLNYNYDGSLPCIQIFQTLNTTVNLGTLSSGTYTVIVWDLDQGFGQLASTSFSVTGTSCPAPSLSQIFASNITSNSATLNGPTGFNATDYQYRTMGSASWIDLNSTTSNFTTISNLLPNTTYEFRISVRCSNNIWSNWSPAKSFVTIAANCPAPSLSQIFASNITSNSATLNGPTGFNATDYQYRVSGSSTWIDVNGTSTNSTSIFNLSPSTIYEFRIAVLCNGNVWSNWSSVKSFITSIPSILNGDDPCTAIETYSENSCIYSDYTTAGASITINPSFQGINCSFNNTNDIWIKVTMPSTGKISVSTLSGSLSDIVVAAYSGTDCSNIAYFGCIDDDSQGNLMPNFTVTSNSQYVWLRIWGFSTNGSFSLCVQTSYQFINQNNDILNDEGVDDRVQKVTKTNTPSDITLSVYPNPSADFAEVVATDLKSKEVDMVLINQEGILVNHFMGLRVENGTMNLKIDISNLPTGIYTLKLSDNDRNITQRIVKI
jgi:hypothetical protein